MTNKVVKMDDRWIFSDEPVLIIAEPFHPSAQHRFKVTVTIGSMGISRSGFESVREAFGYGINWTHDATFSLLNRLNAEIVDEYGDGL